MTIVATDFEPLFNQLLDLTDRVWEADANGQPMDYGSSEQSLREIVNRLQSETIQICGEEVSFDDFAAIITSLNHARINSKRLALESTLGKLAKATKPLSRPGVALDTDRGRYRSNLPSENGSYRNKRR